MAQDERALWERRAVDCGAQLNAVLFARLPESINAYVHDWHCRVIEEQVLDGLAARAEVLDLGCGYGRLGAWIRSRRPDLILTGVDFSLEFCRQYTQRVAAPAVCADIVSLPFAPASFDVILAVTVLMYTEAKAVSGLVAQLVSLLKPGGILLAIDPGAEYLALAHRLGGIPSATGGAGFTQAHYRQLYSQPQAQLGGMPGFSLLLPVALLVSNQPRILAANLALAGWIDRTFPWLTRLTLHRWMRVQIPRHH